MNAICPSDGEKVMLLLLVVVMPMTLSRDSLMTAFLVGEGVVLVGAVRRGVRGAAGGLSIYFLV